jgi:O-acetylserine/cysteine efflux transporter
MKPADTLIVLAVIFVWGVSFPITMLGLNQLPPILFGALRFGMTALILVPFVKPPPRHMMKSVLLFAFTMGFLHFSLFFIGMAGTGASTTAIALNLQVPFAAIIATLFLNDPIGWRRASGMALAVIGLTIVGGEPRILDDIGPFLILISSMLAWAVATAQVKVMEPIGVLRLTGWMALMATPMLLLSSWVFEAGQIEAISNADWTAFLSVAYNSLAVYVFGHGVWYLILQRNKLNNVVPFVLLIPIIGVTTSVLFLGEILTPPMIIGGLLALAGVAIILLRRPAAAADAPLPSKDD